jgi:glyoxylase-like metal-dependent hydrolase (beta-lactamase superfamily II)
VALGEVVEIDQATLLVQGQELIAPKGQPDVANSILHLTGDTLFLVDTGATKAFRDDLTAAAQDIGAWRHLVVLTTHGHVDHVGNNDLADQLADDHRATVQHLVPAKELAQMRDPLAYWTTSLRRLVGVLPGYDHPEEMAAQLVSIFEPLQPFGATTTTFEDEPIEWLGIGPLSLTGWSFCDGAVNVVRSQGHCAGHVMVHIRDSQLLHLADESNGPCGAMHDADQLKILTALSHAATLVESGHVEVLTEGHLFRVNRGADALARAEAFLDQAAALDARVHESLAGLAEPPEVAMFTETLTEAYASLGAEGGNPSPMFLAMMAGNTLRELGMVPNGRDENGRDLA